MRNFFLFVIRHYAVFLFVLLELIALGFVFRYNAYQNSWFVNSANTVSGNVLNNYDEFKAYFSLKAVNDSLLTENAKLRAELNQSKYIDTLSIQTVKDVNGTTIYTYIPAEVIGNSYTELNNYITINRGSIDGIQKDMGVITSEGIVGLVVSVSPHFAVVMPVINTDFRTARVAVKKNNTLGRLQWEGKDPTISKMIEVSEPGTLTAGDTVITTSASSMYPPGTMVGTIEEYGKQQGSNFYTLSIKLATKFSSLHYVYVVNYLRKEEQEALENKKNAGH